MRIDKYDPVGGGFRAPLAADHLKTGGAVGSGTAGIGVGLNNLGRVVPGAGNTGVLGVLVLTRDMKAGDIVDVMSDGEVVDFGGAAGTVYFADTTTGAIGAVGGVGKVRIGATVEVGRLVVRTDRGQDVLATQVVGDQAAIADVAAADAANPADAAYVQAEQTAQSVLANELKAKLNTLLAELRLAGVIAP